MDGYFLSISPLFPLQICVWFQVMNFQGKIAAFGVVLTKKYLKYFAFKGFM